MTKSKKYKSKIQYQTVTVTVVTDKPVRKGECEACRRKIGEGIRTTQLHHYKYVYKPATVKKNPILALENTLELCYGCHPIADALRVLARVKDPYRIFDVYNALPTWIIERLNNKFRLLSGDNDARMVT